MTTFTALTHSAVCLTTGPKPHPKPVLRTVRSSASSFNLQYPRFYLKSSNTCLRFLPHLPFTSIFPSIMCFRRQFLHRLLPIELNFHLFIVCRIFPFSLPLCNTIGPTDLLHHSPAPYFKTFQIFLIYCP